MKVRLSKSFSFEAAHRLPLFPEGHKCRGLHGHSFHFEILVEGEIQPQTGVLVDYGDIKRAVEPIIDRLDHKYLNEIEGLENPTAEYLAKWIFDRVKSALPMLSAVVVKETCSSSCEYRG
jgi:6-pyruvoyltetrahydropterin/6-carboxytetrahydropterin synthase